MQRRILAAVAAFVLAAVGAVLLIGYVGGADERARASEETVPVLVAGAAIPAGTPADQLDGKVSLVDVPARLVVADGLTDLVELGDTPTAAAMLPGDQVSAARFAADDGGEGRGDGRDELSLTLDAQRAVGGNLRDGDRVAVYLTRTTDGVSTSERLYDDVEVTRVGAAEAGGVTGGAFTVTLALTADQAAAVVAGMYDNAVWLSLVDSSTTDTSGE